jgi:Ca-activated chloride channel homolog
MLQSLAEAVRRAGGYRLALVTFAGRADLQCPLTTDYRLFLDRLESAAVDDVAIPGSSIAAALVELPGLFGKLDPSFTDIILVTDGEATDGQALGAAQFLGGQGYRLYTVGVGESSAASIIPVTHANGPVEPLTYRGQVVRTRLREGVLTAMAEATDGRYVGGVDTGALARLMTEKIALEPQRELNSVARDEFDHRFQIFVGGAICLLALEIFLRRSVRWT